MATKIMTTDTHSICPNPGIQEGQEVKMGGKTYRCSRASPFQAFFKGQGFSVPGASKANPVEIEVEVDGELTPVAVQAKGSAKAGPKVDEKEAKLVKLAELLDGEQKEEVLKKLADYRAEKELALEQEKQAEIERLTAEIG